MSLEKYMWLILNNLDLKFHLESKVFKTLSSTLSISVHTTSKSKQPGSHAYDWKLCPILHKGWSTFNIPNSSSFAENLHASLLVVSSSNNYSLRILSLMLQDFCWISKYFSSNISCVRFSRLEYTHCSSTVTFSCWSNFCIRSFVKFVAGPLSSN